MSHLLAIAVGPVQEFIAAARRTRDLWFGSYLLSEISKAVAASVKAHGGDLVFPHPDTDLTPGNERVNVSNLIIAELSQGDPKYLAKQAKVAAQHRWREFAEDAISQTRITKDQQSRVVREDVWSDQVDDVIEFYASWVDSIAEYTTLRDRCARLLAGRKNLRDFRPAKGQSGLPKSSLDGQRESVLHPQAQWQTRFRNRLRIREGEQLDVVGLVKRLAEGNRPYASASRIAADPWVRGNISFLRELIQACEELEKDKILRRLDMQAYPQYADFPFEGTAMYASRHHELTEETEIELERLRRLRDALAKLPEPNPYLAVLVADGDKMGAAISNLPNATANREFSKTLASFAAEAQKIVTDHQGVLVYAGGDDVLALVPVDKCLSCARKLHDKFGELLKVYKNEKEESPTLSVGIAIGHFMENLEDLLDYGRVAEKAAKKPDRDGLAVHLHKRGGGPIHVRSQWTDQLDERLARYGELIVSEAIPGKLPYDLIRLANLYKGYPQDMLVKALQADVLRVIRDKQPKAGRVYLKEIEKLLRTRLTDTVSLYRFSEEILVAKQIAVAIQQSKPRRANAKEVAS